MNGTYLSTVLFLIVSSLGSLYLLIEALLQSLGKGICATEGNCKNIDHDRANFKETAHVREARDVLCDAPQSARAL